MFMEKYYNFISIRVIKVKTNWIIPITVVKRPTFLDLVQPDKAINTDSPVSPIKKVTIPIILGNIKSPSDTADTKPPGVVSINILVIAKSVIKKQHADTVAVFNMRLVGLSSLLDTIILATMAMENPPNSELIKIIWLAKLFQYSRVMILFSLKIN